VKIAINARFLLPNRLEGIGWYSHEVLRRLVEMRPDDTFIFLFDRPFDQQFIFAKNVRGVVLSPPARHPILWWVWFEISVRFWLKKNRPDVFFSPDQFLSISSKTPTILTCHDLLAIRFPAQVPLSARFFYQHFFPKYLKKAAAIIAISETVKADILEITGIDSVKITVASNGCRAGFSPMQLVDIQQVRTENTNGKPYFFYAGAIQPRKNIARLIEAFDLFKTTTHQPHQLLIGGRMAWQTEDVQRAFDAAKHRADIQILGYLPEKKLQVLMAAAETFVFVSLAEGFGLPILEAWHAEVPVITSNCSAMLEIAGKAASLADPHSVEDIAAAMTQLAENESVREYFIEKGRARREEFSWENHAQTVSDLIEKFGKIGCFDA
jgi:glycosyltransferase involved in cell wall biosynthesis